MPSSLGPQEFGLIAAIAAIFVLRVVFPAARVAEAVVPEGGRRRRWPEWTWWETVAVGVAMALLLVAWSQRLRDLASVLTVAGLVLVMAALKGLRTLRGKPR